MLAALSDRSWLWIAAGCYLAGLLLGTFSVIRGGRRTGTWVNLFIVAGYLGQLIGLGLRGREVQGCPLGNTFEVFQFTAWSAITLYFLIGLTFRSGVLGYFTSSLAAILTLVSLVIPSWDASRRAHIFGNNAWIEFHAALALFSYGIFALLALTSAMLLLRLYSLQSKRPGGWFTFLPSMAELDLISVRLLGSGVTVLTASLAVGSVYWIRNFDSVNLATLLFTFGIWTAYVVTLGLRLRGRLIAKRFAWTCAAMFGVALFSLWPVDASRHPVASTTASAQYP